MTDDKESINSQPHSSAETLTPDVPLTGPIPFPDIEPADSDAADEMKMLASTRRTAWVDIAMMLVTLAVLELMFGELFLRYVKNEAARLGLTVEAVAGEYERVILLPALCIRTVVVLGLVAIILNHRGQSARSVGLRWGNVPLEVTIGIVALGVAYGLILVWQMLLLFFWPELLKQMGENAERIMGLVPHLPTLGFVTMALLIGLYEEFFFRGFLMTRLRRGTGNWGLAVVLSTSLFVYLHAFDQAPAALVPIGILSVVFSLVTIWRRSLVPAIIAHFLFDLSQLLYLSYLTGDQWA